jgi:2-C-methyl-D-erythritol 4-phosphate cytidylyltransferase
MAEAEEAARLCGSSSLAADLASALAVANARAATMTDEVRNCNWANATPAFVACDEAIGKMTAIVTTLMDRTA